MTFKDGDYLTDTQEQILDAMIENAKNHWGNDLKDDELAVIRLFYKPIAAQFSQAQTDIGLVLQSAQIDHAEGTQLDLLTALIGVKRDPETKATGEVTFSRSKSAGVDYTVPSGTVVQTDSNDPTKYETTESVVLLEGTTSISAKIESLTEGVETNAGANTATIIPDPPAGVEEVTNPSEITGGTDEETDEVLRERAKEELANGSRASAPALYNSVKSLDGVTSVSLFINDTNTDNTGTGGLPDHSFEVVAAGGVDGEIGQEIFDTKAVGDTSYGGANGTLVSTTADMPNGQTHGIDFSRPTEVKIYIDTDLDVTDEYAGNDALKSNLVQYIGGLLPSGNEESGELNVGEDVIIGEVEYAIRSTAGVYDVNSLTIGKSSSPTGTSNIAIADSEISQADGTDSSMSLTTTTVSP